MKKVVLTKNAPAPIGPYSQAYLCGNTLYCSGQIPLDAKTGEFINGTIEEQTQKCIENISELLNAAGYDFDDVVKTTCFLAEMSDFVAFNEVYAKYFTSKPARSCVAVKELPKNALVEIEVIAVK
ncbi:MAG: RidA family protein [Clostridium sp.]|nr:RidA family protein [Clostridium sp.]